MPKTAVSGDTPGRGRYSCVCCGTEMMLHRHEVMPVCPKCRRDQFVKHLE